MECCLFCYSEVNVLSKSKKKLESADVESAIPYHCENKNCRGSEMKIECGRSLVQQHQFIMKWTMNRSCCIDRDHTIGMVGTAPKWSGFGRHIGSMSLSPSCFWCDSGRNLSRCWKCVVWPVKRMILMMMRGWLRRKGECRKWINYLYKTRDNCFKQLEACGFLEKMIDTCKG